MRNRIISPRQFYRNTFLRRSFARLIVWKLELCSLSTLTGLSFFDFLKKLLDKQTTSIKWNKTEYLRARKIISFTNTALYQILISKYYYRDSYIFIFKNQLGRWLLWLHRSITRIKLNCLQNTWAQIIIIGFVDSQESYPNALQGHQNWITKNIDTYTHRFKCLAYVVYKRPSVSNVSKWLLVFGDSRYRAQSIFAHKNRFIKIGNVG